MKLFFEKKSVSAEPNSEIWTISKSSGVSDTDAHVSHIYISLYSGLAWGIVLSEDRESRPSELVKRKNSHAFSLVKFLVREFARSK